MMALQDRVPPIIMMYRVAESRFNLMILIPDDRTKGEDYDVMVNNDKDGALPPEQPHTLNSSVGMAKVPIGPRPSMLDCLAKAIRYNDLHLIVLDEADRFNDACVEFLCSLFGLTRCPLMLVGIPTEGSGVSTVARLYRPVSETFTTHIRRNTS